MFSSGSDSDAPTRPEREFSRGGSALTSAMGDFESSGGVPVMSPVMTSSSSLLTESMLMGLTTDGALLDAGNSGRAMAVAGEFGSLLEPPPRNHDIEASRNSGISRLSSRMKAGGAAGGGGSRSALGLGGRFENVQDAGGAHHSAGEYGGHQRQVSGGLLLPAAAGFSEVVGVPNGGLGGSGVNSNGSGNNSGSAASPSFVQRRGGPPLLSSEATEPKVGKGGAGDKRGTHLPTPKHRRAGGGGSSGASAGAGEGALANGGGESQQQQGGAGVTQYSGRVSQASSDFTSGSGSESGAAAAPPAVVVVAQKRSTAGAVSAAAVPPSPAPTAPAPPAPPVPAPAPPIDFSNNALIPDELLPEFDSNTTWAGASAYSVATTRTGINSINSALSQRPSSYRSTTGGKLDAAPVWSQQPQARNGSNVSGVSVTSTAYNSNNSGHRRGRSGRANQPERAPGGTPARRGVRNRTNRTDNNNSNSSSRASGMSSGGGGGGEEPNSKPRALARPTSISRKAAMSPHGSAMDAAMRMVEEQGARLGIVREEKEDSGLAAGAAGGGGGINGDQEDAYANQIAAPAMTSLEQRRQRAKAWAKSRYDVIHNCLFLHIPAVGCVPFCRKYENINEDSLPPHDRYDPAVYIVRYLEEHTCPAVYTRRYSMYW